MHVSSERSVSLKELMRLEDALPLMEASFEAGAPFRFFPRGTSMLPMLRQGVDQVSIVSVESRRPQVGEVLLYRRSTGAFVLHRAVGKDGGGFICCGDNQTFLERGVQESAVIGVLEGYFRDGRWISADDKGYRRYAKRRMKTRCLRALKENLRKVIKG